MDRLKTTTLFTALVIAILFTASASAQPTAANVAIISGNGQMTCPNCSFKTFTYFYPMVVKVTDANGNPISGKTVNWSLVSAVGIVPQFSQTTTTDVNGLSANALFQANGQTGSPQFPFLQSVITAYADGASATFTETQALADNFSQQIVFTRLDSPTDSSIVFSGPAGSTGTTAIRVHVDGRGSPVPNVSLRLLGQDYKTIPYASCATQPGADPGSVLTDANGDATCYPVFGPITGKAPVVALIGGLDPAQFDQSISPIPLTSPVAFFQYNGIQIQSTPVTPGRVAIISGNNQSVDPGKSSAPLVASVTDASGNATIANTAVQWTISPAGAGTLNPAQSTTNSSGQTSTVVTLAPNAVGQITVRAALTGSNSGISTTFTISTNVQISSLTKVSGDQQTAQAGKSFAAPLVVQVMGTNGLPVSNQPINFQLISGSASLSSGSSLTDASGRAQISVIAGSTAGAVSISAFIGNINQTFALTVIPPGPALTSSSFYNAGGLNRIGAFSPCSLVTIIAAGLAPNAQGLVLNSNSFGPWGTILSSDTVTVNNIAAPIHSVGTVNGSEQLTFQVPCEVTPGSSVPVTVNIGGGTATVNFPVEAASPGVFETVMSDSARRAVAIRPDGTFVSLQNPARRGEVVRVFVTGLGPATPAVATGALPVPGADSLVVGQVIVGVNNAGTRIVTSRVSPNLLGVYEVAFQIPSDAPTGNDIVLSVAVNSPGTFYSNGSKLPIQ